MTLDILVREDMRERLYQEGGIDVEDYAWRLSRTYGDLDLIDAIEIVHNSADSLREEGVEIRYSTDGTYIYLASEDPDEWWDDYYTRLEWWRDEIEDEYEDDWDDDDWDDDDDWKEDEEGSGDAESYQEHGQ